MGFFVEGVMRFVVLARAIIRAFGQKPKKRHVPARTVRAARSADARYDEFGRYKPTDEDRRFEGIFETHFGPMSDKHFYSKVGGISFSNEDGQKRSELAAQCETAQMLILIREPANSHDSSAVALVTQDGKKLGYLLRDQAHQVAREMDQGRHWYAIVRQITPCTAEIPMGMVVCLLRLSESFVASKMRKSA